MVRSCWGLKGAIYMKKDDEIKAFLKKFEDDYFHAKSLPCLLYTSPSPRDQRGSRMPSSA